MKGFWMALLVTASATLLFLDLHDRQIFKLKERVQGLEDRESRLMDVMGGFSTNQALMASNEASLWERLRACSVLFWQPTNVVPIEIFPEELTITNRPATRRLGRHEL